MYLFYPFILYHCDSNVCEFYLFYSYILFIYFIQGRSENHFCENAPFLKIIIIIAPAGFWPRWPKPEEAP